MKKEMFMNMVPKYPEDDRYEKVAFEEKAVTIPQNRAVRIYCDGIFDMFHYGHARLFEQVKHMFPKVTVVVGVCNDELTHGLKGQTVMNEKERYESVRQCRYVDEVIENAPWTLDIDFLKEHQIDFVAHDEAPYPTPNSSDCYEFVKKIGMFLPTKRAANISTTNIITAIIKNYDLYIRRQILRGIPYKDLNISFLKKEQIRLKNLVTEDMETMKEEFRIAFDFWENFTKKWYSRLFSKNQSVFSKVFSLVEDMKGPVKKFKITPK
jgi:cytidyltransferase-like protein